MILNNLKNIMNNLVGAPYPSLYDFAIDKKYFNGMSGVNTLGFMSQKTYCWLALGTGTTPALKTDVQLESQIPFSSSGLARLSNTLSNLSNFLVNCSGTFKNNSSEDIIINEIGICTNFKRSSKDSYYGSALLTREVLETPIVFHPGDIKTITAKITY